MNAAGMLFYSFADFLKTLPGNNSPAFGAVGNTHPGKKEAEIVINLGGGGYRGAGIGNCLSLLNGNGRRKSADIIYVWFFQLLKELPGVGREGLNVAALSFRIEGIKS